MITIYKADETNFNNNGLAVLQPINCIVKEELNGAYLLELKHPLDKENKWAHINEGNIIKAPTPRGYDLFRIYKKTITMNIILANARHISYDLLDNFLEDVRPTNLTGSAAINWILSKTQFPHQFKGSSDISKVNSASYIRKNPMEALLSDDENSFINRWGGEILRNNFDIKMLNSIGKDRGVHIKYGKNLLGLDCDTDIDGVVTRSFVSGLNSNDTVLTLPEKYIDSQYINSYPNPKIQYYHFPDVKVGDNLTEVQAYELLREKARNLYTINNVDIPIINMKVKFLQLSNTEEYKKYKMLETIYLGDIVTIQHLRLNMDIKAKMINYCYNSLLKKYVEIELGDFKKSISNAFKNVSKMLSDVSKEIVNNKSDFQKAIDNATALLTNALGGHVLKRAGEILIMDTEDPNTCQKVWRLNLNGLGYSSTGINGNFETAITMDGHIVGSFITGLVITGGQIRTGVISSLDNSVNIDLSNGKIRFGKGAVYTEDYAEFTHDDNTKTKIGKDGLERIAAGSSKPYHYLSPTYTYSGEKLSSSKWKDEVIINYPPEFNGKTPDISTSISRLVCKHYLYPDEFYSIVKFEVYYSRYNATSFLLRWDVEFKPHIESSVADFNIELTISYTLQA